MPCSRSAWHRQTATTYPTGIPPFIDEDQDGIDDREELRIATALLPPIWISSHEFCPRPDAPKPIMFRARYPRCASGAQPRDYILINYYVLFDEDCGLGGHRGDNEGFVVFGRLIGGQWQRDSISATCHADTLCEQRTSVSGPGFGVFSSGNKHSNFTNADACTGGPPFCDNGDCRFFPPQTYQQRGVRLFNVGEPWRHLLETYYQIHPNFWGYIWTGSMMDAGEAHFDLTRYNVATAPPPGCGNWVIVD